MNTLPRSAGILYTILLAIAASLCVWALVVTIKGYGGEPAWQTVRRSGTAIVTLVVTAAFAIAMIKGRARPVALPLFVTSFCAVGASLDVALHGYMKSWAPATPPEASYNNHVAVVIVTATLAFAVFAVWYSCRKPRHSG